MARTQAKSRLGRLGRERSQLCVRHPTDPVGETVWPNGSDGTGPTLEFGYCDSTPLLFRSCSALETVW